MPDNGLAPPNMPWLWQPNSPVGQPNGLGPPMLNYAAQPNPAAPTVGQGVAQTAADVAQAWPSVEEQRRMLQPLPGWQGTAVDAAKQWAEGVMMGTTAPGEVPPPGIVAYHGSPHSFDQFDTSKIGTGEGAQAYGHGLYFAGNEGVARSYRDALAGPPPNSGVHVDGVPAEDAGLSPSAIALAKMHLDGFSTLDDLRASNEASLQRAQDALQRMPNSSVGIANRDMANRTLDALDELKGRDLSFQQPKSPGSMYQVNIGADPEHFLDWDKPLSEQSQHVQDALGKVPWTEPYLQSGKFPGSQIAPTTPEGAQQLRDAGVAGIKYLDQGSRATAFGEHIGTEQTPQGWQAKIRTDNRGGGAGGFQAPTSIFTTSPPFPTKAAADAWAQDKIGSATHNYVVFDANTIDILRKYGLAGLIAGGGAAAAATQQQQPSQ